MTAAAALPLVEQIQLIDLGDLEIHPSNPRRDVGDIGPLAASLKKSGMIEPIVAVKGKGGKLQIVAGSRRLAAAKKAGLTGVPVRVMELDEAEATAAALIENIQRKELAPLEEAAAFRGWLTLTGKPQKDLAEAVGLNESTISNALRLLEAPKPVKDALGAGSITAAHARVALQLKDPGAVSALKLGEKPESVDQLKERVDRINADYDVAGPGGLEAARQELARLQKAHPKTTFAWRAVQGYYADKVPRLAKALGKSPTIAGHLAKGTYMGAPTAAQHDKVCDCDALEIVAERQWNNGKERLSFRTQRVCIKAANYKKANKIKQPLPGKKKAGAAAKAKPLTAEQRAKLEKAAAEDLARRRKVAEAAATKLLVAPKPRDARYAPLARRLAKGQIPADVARAIVFHDLLDPDSAGGAQIDEDLHTVIAWQRVVAMPAKKVSALAAAVLANAIATMSLYGPMTQENDPMRHFAQYFGIKVPAIKTAKKKRGR